MSKVLAHGRTTYDIDPHLVSKRAIQRPIVVSSVKSHHLLRKRLISSEPRRLLTSVKGCSPFYSPLLAQLILDPFQQG